MKNNYVPPIVSPVCEDHQAASMIAIVDSLGLWK